MSSYDLTTKLETRAAAAYCGCSKSTLEKLRVTGGGPAYLQPTRKVVYQVSDLDAWLAHSRRASTSERPGGTLQGHTTRMAR